MKHGPNVSFLDTVDATFYCASCFYGFVVVAMEDSMAVDGYFLDIPARTEAQNRSHDTTMCKLTGMI